MTAIAIIPARGGSRRIPRKNIRLFHGKPIIEYSIDAARASGLFERVVVSTDDREIGDIAKAAGAFVFARDADDGNRGTQEVAAEVLRETSVDYACCIYPCAPMVDARELRAGFGLLTLHNAAYVYPVLMRGDTDPGQWYWGQTSAFLSGVPLGQSTKRLCLPDEFCIDINTEDDWKCAEAVYEALHKVPA